VLTRALWLVAGGTFLVNLPFGYWRGGARRFTAKWITAIHAPVPLVVAMRLAAGVRWQLMNLPVLLGAYFLGQLLGTRARGWTRAEEEKGVKKEEGTP
jgi:hypothetical protein